MRETKDRVMARHKHNGLCMCGRDFLGFFGGMRERKKGTRE